ncbi:hypothetical protein [Enterococcus durans]|uniref:hypothetical protein n=1 Tax=Enterococcus durans TaxID=53345 RepID=UPI00189ECAFE|nr:hypothetical protein [Enterococcus durans]MDB1684465.1 hypothetical protein [Enterococcus durans]
MATYTDLLPEATENQQAFILDHGKTENDGQLKYADDAKSYGWNIRQYGKLKAGAVVLNRHPGKITKDRKWEIYGGGYVESISEPDEAGNVTAVITHAFTIEPPIKQGDSFIENFSWNSPSKKKRKKPNSWAYFWDQYGMNEITYVDFVGLIENRHLVPIDDKELLSVETDLTNAEVEEIEQASSESFTVLVDEVGPNRPNGTQKRKFTGRNTDWERVNKSKQKTGALGEEIVLDILTQEAEKHKLKLPEHVSKTKYSDGFEMSANEVAASLEGTPYKIYFVHDLDVVSKECKIKIYDGPFTDESFKMIPSTYKIYQK